MGLPVNCEINLHSSFPKGKRNLITDVPGVKVGHVTLGDAEKNIHTGVTAILPHEGNLFRDKVLAGASVINGFGKSAGLVQVDELGTIEAPILMTNTFGVGTGLNGAIRYMLEQNPDIGISTGTVNCVVTECNDGSLNDIRGLHLREEHVREAIEKAGEEFEEGAVGGGTGMICMGLKGGIGSASRIIECDGEQYTLGAIVMSNFGVEGNLRIDGKRLDTTIQKQRQPVDTTQLEERQSGADRQELRQSGVDRQDLRQSGADRQVSLQPGTDRQESVQLGTDWQEPVQTKGMNHPSEKGSVIIVLATDIPLNERQLRRVAKRSVVGLARTGSYLGNGSGDIAIAFSNGNRVPHYSDRDILTIKMFHDNAMDKVFAATAEVVEEAVISSLYHGEAMRGIRNKKVHGLREYL